MKLVTVTQVGACSQKTFLAQTDLVGLPDLLELHVSFWIACVLVRVHLPRHDIVPLLDLRGCGVGLHSESVVVSHVTDLSRE